MQRLYNGPSCLGQIADLRVYLPPLRITVCASVALQIDKV
jgi:hypothetical protein